MRILVTGALGFIGSHLVDKLIKEGHEVYGIDDFSGGNWENRNNQAHYFNVDCRNYKKILEIFTEIKPQIVYHLAANAAENKAQFSPIDITSRNYDSFIKVLSAFIKTKGKRFIFTSSIAVYGNNTRFREFYEEDLPQPEDLYGITKLAAEQTLAVMSKVHGFEYVITRPHNVYGERQNMTDPYRNVCGIWMNAILGKKPWYIYGSGTQRRCFSYISDVVHSLYLCGFENVSDMTFNIGSDKDYSLNALSKLLIEITQTKSAPLYLQERPQEVKIAIANHDEIRKHLDWEETKLQTGLTKMWEWAKTQGYQKPFYTKLELPNEKVPKNWL